MEIEGMIIRDLGETGGTSQRTGNPWRKHGWVMEIPGQYPRKAKFDVFGDRCSTMTFELGKTYAVQVDVESREFNDKWYTDLRAYAARPVEGGVNVGPVTSGPDAVNMGGINNGGFQSPATPPQNPFNNPEIPQSDSQEDLPF